MSAKVGNVMLDDALPAGRRRRGHIGVRYRRRPVSRIAQRKETVVTSVYSAAAVVAETAKHSDEGMVWWAVGLLTFGSIALLGVVLTLMTLHERKRHPHP
jgi:putative copper export protein